jgi:hypothetical protein
MMMTTMIIIIIIIIRQWALSTPGAIHFNFWFKSAYRNEHLTPRHCFLSFRRIFIERLGFIFRLKWRDSVLFHSVNRPHIIRMIHSTNVSHHIIEVSTTLPCGISRHLNSPSLWWSSHDGMASEMLEMILPNSSHNPMGMSCEGNATSEISLS